MKGKENNNINDNLIKKIINQMSKSDLDQFMKNYNKNKSTINNYTKRGRPKKIINESKSIEKNKNLQKENNSTSDIVDLTNETESSEKKYDKLNLTIDMKRKRGRPKRNKSVEPINKISENIFLSQKRKRDSNKNNNSLNNNYKNEIYVTPELKNLLNLEKEYGFSKLINCLYKPNIDISNNILEKNMNEIINKISLQTTIILLIQIQTMSSSNKKEILNNSQNLLKNKKIETTINLIEDDIEIESKNNKFLCENNKKKLEKNYKPQSEIKSVRKRTNEIKSVTNLKNFENMELCIHYHREKKDIYKFAKHHQINMKKIWIFYCCDKDCGGQATYEISSKKFKIIHEHTKSNKEHNYFKKIEMDKNISNFKNTNFNEAQIFKKNDGSKIIHWYN